MNITQQPISNMQHSSEITWVPMRTGRSEIADAICFSIADDDSRMLGHLLLDVTCAMGIECSGTILDMTCVDASFRTASIVLLAFEEHMTGRYEALYVELSAVYDKAIDFWMKHGYRQIADLLHTDDDAIITMGKLLPQS